MIPLFWPQTYPSEWLEELSGTFTSRWLGQGPKVEEFEREFGRKFGYEFCLGVNSGSAALELAYELIGIGAGDEVISTCFTCTATNIPLLRRKAKIVFADINDSLLIDVEDIQRKLTKKTKAIVAVTLGGLALDGRIFDLAEKHKVPLVIDTAQSLGRVTSRGDYLCYSFQAIKHFTTGDGGMLVVRNQDAYGRAKKLRWFGIDREAKKRADWKCLVNHQMAMEIEEAGFKFHMNDIAASMGLVGLRHSDEILNQRQWVCQGYHSTLPKTIQSVYGGSCWLYAVLSDDRDRHMEILSRNGVECDLVQLRNDVFKVFGGQRQDLPNMNRLEGKYFYLPLNSRVSVADAERIGRLLW